MSNYRYEIIIYYSNIDGCYIAEVPELAGCIADGNNYNDCLSNIKIVIDEWIETATELGRTIPSPKCRKLEYA